MKQPYSKLPFSAPNQYSYMGGRQIVSTGVVATVHFKGPGAAKKDAEYITEACNNYPKAIELLQWALENGIFNYAEDYSHGFGFTNQVKNFLKDKI